MFQRRFWRELELSGDPEDQAVRLAEQVGFDPDQSASLLELFPPLSQTAALAARYHDPELAESVAQALKRVLVALASTDAQIWALDDLFGTITEKTP